MIQQDMLYKPSFNYIKKERFTGSINGMRYMLEKGNVDEKDFIRVCHWPEPLCFEKTDEEKKTFNEFEFSKEGLDEAWQWLSDAEEGY